MLTRVGLFLIIYILPEAFAWASIHQQNESVPYLHKLALRALDKAPGLTGETEGGIVDEKTAEHAQSNSRVQVNPPLVKKESKVSDNITTLNKPSPSPNSPAVPNEPVKNQSLPIPPPDLPHTTIVNKEVPKNVTEPDPIEMNNPAALKRALIVFSGFLVLAVAYWVTIGRKSKNLDTNTGNSTNDANQFRYGVLQSERGDDNLELSRIPLTMESDDDDEDMEIFDLGQRKKSLSYVNLQTNDDDVDLNLPNEQQEERFDRNNLIDIGDGDTLINLQSDNSSKFVL